MIARYLSRSVRSPTESVRTGSRGSPAQKARAFREACRTRGVAVYSANPAYLDPPAHAELLMGYGGLDPPAIREGVRRIRLALDAVRRR